MAVVLSPTSQFSLFQLFGYHKLPSMLPSVDGSHLLQAESDVIPSFNQPKYNLH